MFRIISPKLLELFHTRTLSSNVALHFNVNYWRPYWVVTFSQASLLSCSAAPVGVPFPGCVVNDALTSLVMLPGCVHAIDQKDRKL